MESHAASAGIRRSSVFGSRYLSGFNAILIFQTSFSGPGLCAIWSVLSKCNRGYCHLNQTGNGQSSLTVTAIITINTLNVPLRLLTEREGFSPKVT